MRFELNDIDRSKWIYLALVAWTLICTVAQASENEGPIRIACVGDSITFGATIKDREANSYPAQLQGLLGEAYDVRNFGVNGATLLQRGNKPYRNRKEYRAAQAFEPTIVIIKLGTNDSKPVNWEHQDDFVANYVELIESFRALSSKPKVIICKPVPVFPENFTITDQVVKGEVIPKIEMVAKQAKVDVIDLYEALSDQSKLFRDKVHPNAQGAKIMAETIHEFLRVRAENLKN